MIRIHGPEPLRRGTLAGAAVEVLLPKGVGSRHFSDAFSVSLQLARRSELAGRAWVGEWAAQLAPLVPGDTDCIAVPPRGRRRVQKGDWYLPQALAEAVASRLGLPSPVLLRWCRNDEPGDRGQRCDTDLTGQAVCLADDFWLTGLTCEAAAQALTTAGAASVFVVCLGIVERTVWRPDSERALLAVRGGRRRAKQVLAEEPGEAGAWKEAVLERGGGACRVCGSRENLTAHHVWAQGERPDLRRDVRNGVTVCSPCHQWLHSSEAAARRRSRELRIVALAG